MAILYMTLRSRSSQGQRSYSFFGYCAHTIQPIFTKFGVVHMYSMASHFVTLGMHDLEVKVTLRSKVISVFGFCAHITQAIFTKLGVVHVQSMAIHNVTLRSRSSARSKVNSTLEIENLACCLKRTEQTFFVLTSPGKSPYYDMFLPTPLNRFSPNLEWCMCIAWQFIM